jgi:hypothetical protein
MTITAMNLPFLLLERGDNVLDELSKHETSMLKLNFVLEDYTDKQIKKIITGLEQGTQWEADYLKHIILHLLKSQLRERKLNQLL